jgi:hypothetical protein
MKYRFIIGFSLITLIPMLAACGSSTTSSSSKPGQTAPPGAQTVHVTLSHTRVDSSLTTFTDAMPYHFVVTNTGQVVHQFVMIPMGMGMEHMSSDEMHHAALYMYDSVAPGETRVFDYTFASSVAGQS